MTLGRVDLSKMDGYLAKANRAANAGLTVAAISASGYIKRGFSKGARHASSQPGTPPNVQRGFLRRAVGSEPSTNLRSRVGVARSIKYAAIHEFGGTIRPIRSKYLTVPIIVHAKRAMERTGGNVRATVSKEGLFFLPRRGRDPLFCKRVGRGRNATIQPWFVLKKSVRIPKRPYIRPGVFNNIRDIRRDAIAEARRVMGGAT